MPVKMVCAQQILLVVSDVEFREREGLKANKSQEKSTSDSFLRSDLGTQIDP